jgi:copper chaperone CopZ
MADPMTHTFAVDGMECGHCVTIIASAVRGLDGVQSTAVDRTVGTVTVHGTSLDDQVIRDSILEAGYTVHR